MPEKRLHYLTVLIIVVAVFALFYAIKLSSKGAEFEVEKAEVGNLAIHGDSVQIMTSSFSTNTSFIFLKEGTNTVLGTLTIANAIYEPPTYRVVKGQQQDWLVVTSISAAGTGILGHKDEWYVLGWSYEPVMVLSYESDIRETPGNGWRNRYLSSEVITKKSDKEMDIKYLEKICETTQENEERDCVENAYIDNYIFDVDTLSFRPKD